MPLLPRRRVLGLIAGLALAVPAPVLAEPTLVVSASGRATDLPLDSADSASTRIVRIAAVAVDTDDPGGLTLSIGAGALARARGETPIAVQLTLVPDGAGTPAASAFDVPPGHLLTFATRAPGPRRLDLYARYATTARQDPGLYAGSISLFVRDN